MRTIVTIALVLALAGTARAQEGEAELSKKRAQALEKGIAWVKKQQKDDGRWEYLNEPFTVGIAMKQGCTALACLALLKSGVEPEDPVIEKGFVFMAEAKIQHVYSAGCVLLALEARYRWEPPPDDPEGGNGTRARKGKKGGPGKPRLSPRDLELAEKCRDFLVKFQEPCGAWSYPLPGVKPDERSDSSHPQYALLGLDAATRLGLEVPRDVWIKAAGYFVDRQEKDGPEVPTFPVPGADMTWKELQKIEKELRDKIQKIEAEFSGKKPGETNKAGRTEEDERRTVEREASGKILKTGEKVKMRARGWCYASPPAKVEPWKQVVNGSMTTSALASLFTCKAHLDGGADYEKMRAPIDKALRDGAAWIAKNYTVEDNPPKKGGMNHYYYLYGLERAGILGLVPLFGQGNWYDDGCQLLLKAQREDGSWDAGPKGTSGPVVDTAFALLFLSRGTTPLIRIPTRIATGPGR